jgi:glyoxylase-like metal-dependent hydrolase (beta-lactamase superfamily II)
VLGEAGGLRLLPESWLDGAATLEQVREGLRLLLDLPVELVLPTHGDPAGREALERALAG